MQINKLKKYPQLAKLITILDIISELNEEGDMQLLQDSYQQSFRIL